MTLRDKLKTHYRESGIFPVNSSAFGCKHLEKCRICGSCGRPLPFTRTDAKTLREVEHTFTPGYSAFVGELYGRGVPRLLFVAADLGTVLRRDDKGFSYVAPESRTPEGVWKVRNRVMERLVNETDRSDITGKPIRRWTVDGTNEQAECILGKSGPEVMRHFAHTNAVKCTINKGDRGQADDHLFKNCREGDYLRGEIRVLRPDIIVTHGGKARLCVEHAFREDKIEPCAYPNVFVVKIRDAQERRVFWLNTYHPSKRSRKKFDDQMCGKNHGPCIRGKLRVESQNECLGLEGYAKLIREFISTRDSIPR